MTAATGARAHDSEEGERRVQARVDAVLGDLGVVIEASNQARVHLGYEAHFGRPYAALRDTRDAIDRFLVAETCVGMTPSEHYAPHGLEGLAQGTLTPNPAMHAPEFFAAKAASYRARWPWLTVSAATNNEPAGSATPP